MNKISHIKKKYMSNPSKVLTLANIISLLRAASAIPIIYTLNYPELRAVTAGIVILAILSDALDGYFARRAGEVTHLGMWLDPIADFIIITSVVLYLVIMEIFPLWFFLLTGFWVLLVIVGLLDTWFDWRKLKPQQPDSADV